MFVHDNRGYLALAGTQRYFSPERMRNWKRMLAAQQQNTEIEESELHLTGLNYMFLPSPFLSTLNVLAPWAGAVLKASDMWALGVCVFILVTGAHPFADSDRIITGIASLRKLSAEAPAPLILVLCAGKYEFPQYVRGASSAPSPTTSAPTTTATLSAAVTDFIRLTLHPDPSQRLTVAQALQHPWITGAGAGGAHSATATAAGSDAPFTEPVMHAIRRFFDADAIRNTVFCSLRAYLSQPAPSSLPTDLAPALLVPHRSVHVFLQRLGKQAQAAHKQQQFIASQTGKQQPPHMPAAVSAGAAMEAVTVASADLREMLQSLHKYWTADFKSAKVGSKAVAASQSPSDRARAITRLTHLQSAVAALTAQSTAAANSARAAVTVAEVSELLSVRSPPLQQARTRPF
jgi:hypothetical protein